MPPGNDTKIKYYQTVRSTIQGLDSLRITTISQSVTMSIAIIALSLTSIKYISIEIHGINIMPFIASFLCVVNSIIIYQYYKKIVMFNSFLHEACNYSSRCREGIT